MTHMIISTLIGIGGIVILLGMAVYEWFFQPCPTTPWAKRRLVMTTALSVVMSLFVAGVILHAWS
jgi:hypothetical protein